VARPSVRRTILGTTFDFLLFNLFRIAAIFVSPSSSSALFRQPVRDLEPAITRLAEMAPKIAFGLVFHVKEGMNTQTRAPAPDTRRRRRVRPNCSDSPAIQLDFFLGTFAPFFRASESPMAIAWDLLFTRPPLPPFPDFSVPCFRRVIALLTDLPAAFPYLGIVPPVFSFNLL